jgi:hypothetical protein
MSQRSPNDIIGVACIGVGTQGHRLLQWAQAVPNTEIRIICDLYEGNRQRAQKLTRNENVRFVREWEKTVADPNVDVVIVAAPDFWHAPMVIAAAKAKKDIYVEKGLCIKLDEAKKIRKAVTENKVVLQLGHNYNSLPTFHKAREIFQSGVLGKVPLIRTYIDRTGPFQEWKFYTDYHISKPPDDASPETIDWARFIANAPRRPFDIDRFFTWRCYWDYGTGIAGDLLSHLWDSVNMVAGMGIPESAVTQGGKYFWHVKLPTCGTFSSTTRSRVWPSRSTARSTTGTSERWNNFLDGTGHWRSRQCSAGPTTPNGSRSLPISHPRHENWPDSWD